MLLLSLQKQREMGKHGGERKRKEREQGEDDQEVDWGNCEKARVYRQAQTERRGKNVIFFCMEM